MEGEPPAMPEREKPSSAQGEGAAEAPKASRPESGKTEKPPIQKTWANWLGTEESFSGVSEELKTELIRMSRRPLSMETTESLYEAYMRIEELNRTQKIKDEEAIEWGAKIGDRHAQKVQQEEKAKDRAGILDALKPALTGAAVAGGEELGERVGGAIADRIRGGARREERKRKPSSKEEADTGTGGRGGEEPPKGGEPPKEEGGEPEGFIEIQERIISDDTSEEERKVLMKKREEMLNEFKQKDPETFDEIVQTVMNTLKDSDWNHVRKNIANLADNLENEAKRRHGFDPKHEGMVRAAVIGLSLQVSETGFDKRKFIESPGSQEDLEWLSEHGMSEEALARLHKRVEREAFFPLGVNPHEFVAASLPEAGQRLTPEELHRLMLEGRLEGRSASLATSPPPNEVVAIFRDGRLGMFEEGWKDKVEFLDIRNKDDLQKWAFLNMEVFNNGIIANPYARWKGTIDFWLTDLRDASRLAEKNRGLSVEQKEAIRETEKLIKAMMAVSASARIMEVTSGAAARYASYLTPGTEGPDLDKSDEWAEFIIHDDKGAKFEKVVGEPMVRYFYIKLLEDAGYGVPQEWIEDPGLALSYTSIDKIRLGKGDINRAREGKLIKFLALEWGGERPILDEDGNPLEVSREIGGKTEYKQGFDSYIEWLLTAEENRALWQGRAEFTNREQAEIWAAAKLACDAFLIDKFTKWEYEVAGTEEAKTVRGWRSPYKYIMPFPGWGGNPLTVMIMPSFLPRVIKGVYTNEDNAVMNLTDMAFHPEKITVRGDDGKPKEIKVKHPPASMVSNYKSYIRYCDAHWRFLGGSRGQGIPVWTSRVMEEDIPKMADLLDQVYRDQKELMGVMMARIIQAKALATAVESQRPGFKGAMQVIFDPENRTRPFLEVMQTLWGPDYDARRGLLAALAGGRTRFVFKGVPEAETAILDAYALMRSNDQDVQGRGRAKLVNTIGFVMDAAQAIAGGGGKRR